MTVRALGSTSIWMSVSAFINSPSIWIGEALSRWTDMVLKCQLVTKECC